MYFRVLSDFDPIIENYCIDAQCCAQECYFRGKGPTIAHLRLDNLPRGMSSFLLRSLQQSCCRRLPLPVASSFAVPRQNYLIVYSPGDQPPEYATRSRVTKYEVQKRALREDEENETHEYGSDPYPFFRKVTAI